MVEDLDKAEVDLGVEFDYDGGIVVVRQNFIRGKVKILTRSPGPLQRFLASFHARRRKHQLKELGVAELFGLFPRD